MAFLLLLINNKEIHCDLDCSKYKLSSILYLSKIPSIKYLNKE